MLLSSYSLTQLENEVLPAAIMLVASTRHEEDVEGGDIEHADKQADHNSGHFDGPQEGKAVIHEAPAHPDADED